MARLLQSTSQLIWAGMAIISIAGLTACGDSSDSKRLNAPPPKPNAAESGEGAKSEANPPVAVQPPDTSAVAAKPVEASELESMSIIEINERASEAEKNKDMTEMLRWRIAAVEKTKMAQPLGREYLDALRVLGFFYHFQGPADKAIETFLELVKQSEAIFGPEDAIVADSLSHLTAVYSYQGKNEEALALYPRLIALQEKHFTRNSLHVERTYQYQAECLKRLGREAEAAEAQKKSDEIKAALAEAESAK